MLLGMALCAPLLAGRPEGVAGVEEGARLSLVRGYLFVDVRINNRGPFRMALDTGNTSCVVTPSAAAALGLVPDERVVLTTAAGERVIPAVTSTRVEVGSAAADGVEVLVDSLEGIRIVGGRIDGVLGQSFLSRVSYLIDYRQARLWVGPEADRLSSRVGSPVAAEILRGRVFLPVMLEPGGRTWRMVLDTGANDLLLGCGSDCPRAASVTHVRTNAGGRIVRTATLRQVRVGGLRFADREALLIGKAAHLEQGDGLLPGAWFSAIYVERGGKVVRLAP